MSTAPTNHPTIDFLPAKYREATAQRKTKAWRLVVVVLFGALLVAAAVGQYGIRYSVMGELERVRPEHAAAIDEQNRLTTLGKELRPARAAADLLTYLHHPWPTSQVVAAAIEPLPDTVVLNKLALHREMGAIPPAPPQTEEQMKAAAAAPAEERDLAKLRTEFDHSAVVLTLQGTTRDIVDLHEYLGALASNDLFKSAELTSLDRPDNSSDDVSRFTVRIEVKPGYGQAKGPRTAPAAVDTLELTAVEPSTEPKR